MHGQPQSWKPWKSPYFSCLCNVLNLKIQLAKSSLCSSERALGLPEGKRLPGSRESCCVLPLSADLVPFNSNSMTQSGGFGGGGSSLLPLLSCLQTMHFSAPRRSRGVFDKASCCKARQVLNSRAKFSKQIKEEAPKLSHYRGFCLHCPLLFSCCTAFFCFPVSYSLSSQLNQP